MKILFWYCLILGLCLPYCGICQESSNETVQIDTLDYNRVTFIAVPLLFYLPETNLGFGGASNLSLHWKYQDRSERPTQFTIGAAYTLNKQLLTYMAYNIYLPQEIIWFRGELGYYDYVYPYFGMGQNRAEENANFFSNYPRLNLDILYQIGDDIFVGLSYSFDDYEITDIDDSENLFGGIDLSGGITSGIGIAAVIDTRDVINYPKNGMLLDFVLQNNTDLVGATYDYYSFVTSVSKYLPIRSNVLAVNFNSINIFGDAPFYEMALYGGGKRSRGYVEGEYRASNSFALQAEYRFRFTKKLSRFGAVVFASAGQVFDRVDELSLSNSLPAVGGGIRFLLSREQNLNLRADIGIGKNGTQFYVTFGEAF